jgi:sugar-phosphatase
MRNTVDEDNELFRRTFDAVLFDLDGSLVDSTASVVRCWRRFAQHFGVSMDALHDNHGQPAATLIRKLLPLGRFDEGKAKITELEVEDAMDLPAVRGAQALFESIPDERRAIVTSGSVTIASARLSSAGFPRPRVWVTAEDVERGKPDPQPFLIAAERLGVDPSRCLVIEDAAAGITAAKAAGCGVIGVTGTEPIDRLSDADVVLDGLDRIRLSPSPLGDAMSAALVEG